MDETFKIIQIIPKQQLQSDELDAGNSRRRNYDARTTIKQQLRKPLKLYIQRAVEAAPILVMMLLKLL